MKIVPVAVLALTLAGCVEQQPPAPQKKLEHTRVVTIRAVDWYHQTIVFENDYGWGRTMELCDPPLQFYVGERVDIYFYRLYAGMDEKPGGINYDYGCFRVYETVRGPIIFSAPSW